MRIDGYARWALLGTLVISLACARNSEEMDDTTATGRATTVDTATTADTATVDPAPTADTVARTMPDTTHPDSTDWNVSPIDSVRTGTLETDPDSMGPPSTRSGTDSLQGGR